MYYFLVRLINDMLVFGEVKQEVCCNLVRLNYSSGFYC
jgi:hypothetical protein